MARAAAQVVEEDAPINSSMPFGNPPHRGVEKPARSCCAGPTDQAPTGIGRSCEAPGSAFLIRVPDEGKGNASLL